MWATHNYYYDTIDSTLILKQSIKKHQYPTRNRNLFHFTNYQSDIKPFQYYTATKRFANFAKYTRINNK